MGLFIQAWTVDPCPAPEAAQCRPRRTLIPVFMGPVKLVYVEAVPDRSAALKREEEIKRLGHAGKLKLIAYSETNLAAEFGADLTESEINECAAN